MFDTETLSIIFPDLFYTIITFFSDNFQHQFTDVGEDILYLLLISVFVFLSVRLIKFVCDLILSFVGG